MGVKVKRVVGRAHSMIERGKKIPIQELHYMMGHTESIASTHVNIVQEENSYKPTYQKFPKNQQAKNLGKEYSLTSVQ